MKFAYGIVIFALGATVGYIYSQKENEKNLKAVAIWMQQENAKHSFMNMTYAHDKDEVIKFNEIGLKVSLKFLEELTSGRIKGNMSAYMNISEMKERFWVEQLIDQIESKENSTNFTTPEQKSLILDLTNKVKSNQSERDNG